jgi:hypothetical protein
MFLGLSDQDPLVRDTDPDPSIIKQKMRENILKVTNENSRIRIRIRIYYRSMDPRIRIRTKISGIRNTAFNHFYVTGTAPILTKQCKTKDQEEKARIKVRYHASVS